ncbi:hypothetical protein GO495_17535 [Chitinophaga oryziterrae]|uniref:Copper chaperone NosL n=1 Tax=Chitinophaga oryziterrae TaxID=1031224 RepID=A0A6N8JDP5_9BACT|nr:hypothetical protein [Chitinophaga oryziterrae]MVT42399.1 hypothetical protein [Chitinophaga oryziterrae]
MKTLTKPGKISIVIVMLFLATLWLFPLWRIDLRAPQYPGGLSMQIWLNDLKGDVPIINGLNHYIGMQEINKKDFREFIFLPAAILLFILFGFLVLLLKKKIYYYIWTALFIVIACFSFYDFYMWEYNYGHHLNPHAPIRVPGMSYQPPLFGYKKLLNFEVLSQPDIAGWFFIGAGMLLASMTIYEWKKNEK